MTIAPKRILIIPPRFIGDAVIATGLINVLHHAFPEAHIHVLVPASLANLYERDSRIDDILVLDKSFRKTLFQLRSRQYEVGILLRRSLSQAALLKLSGIHHVLGFRQQHCLSSKWELPLGLFIDKAVTYPPLKDSRPHLALLSQVLAPLDIPDDLFKQSLFPSIALDNHDTDIADFLLQKHNLVPEKTAVIHVHSASREKAMRLEQFVLALKTLSERGWSLLALGPQSDAASYKQLSELANVTIINACGETTLRETTAIFKRVGLLFSLDSGPVHMAAAAEIAHIIAIYGPTNDAQWRPWPYKGHFTAITNTQLTCRPCAPKCCSHNKCRTDLTAEIIADAVKQHLESAHE